mmetsp:Transcript_1068/g.2760  ORF Transcript_1068/g.2760 Transcript_1068/m.2760 type:complete len:88 (-) Transcript_1068:194-457(-)
MGMSGKEGGEAIGILLNELPMLHTLALDNCDIGPEGTLAMAPVLERHTMIRSLNFNWNRRAINDPAASSALRAAWAAHGGGDLQTCT